MGHIDRTIAQADDPIVVAVFEYRFCHHGSWIGEVNQPGVWTNRLHFIRYFNDDRNGAQSFEHPARTVGFLANKTV